MRAEADRRKIEQFIEPLAQRVSGGGRIYLTGGATAVLVGWRSMTIDVDVRPEPEPAGFFEAIAQIKDALDVNVDLASPSDFIPELPGWRERSLFVGRVGDLEFFHFDPYSQALAKLERGHDRDLADVREMLARGMIERDRLWGLFECVESGLLRYPAIEPAAFRRAVQTFCQPPEAVEEAPASWAPPPFDTLPGAELVAAGLADIRAGRVSPASCLVWIANPRLRQHGLLNADDEPRRIHEPELALYRLLRCEPGNAFGNYNSLLRRLVKFEHALDRVAR